MRRNDYQQRVITIDLIRGISMFLMIMIHVEKYWLDADSLWILCLKFIILDVSGVSQFVFISGVAFAFSYQKNIKKLKSRNLTIKKSITRTFIMILLSLIYNGIIVIIWKGDWKEIWFWTILQTIAFSRLLGTLIIGLSKKIRIFLAFGLVFATGILVSWMVPIYLTDFNANIIFLIFFKPLHGDGILIFFPFFIIGTILGELIQNLMENHNKSIENQDSIPFSSLQLKKLFGIGVIILLFGILIGLTPNGSDRDYYSTIQGINTHPNIEISTLPLFLLPNSYSWCFYCMGWHIMLTSFLIYYLDLRNRNLKQSNILLLFGRYSFTIYIGHYLFLFMPFWLFNSDFAVNYIWIWPCFIGFEMLIWGIIYLIDKIWHGKVSIEVSIAKISEKLYDILNKK